MIGFRTWAFAAFALVVCSSANAQSPRFVEQFGRWAAYTIENDGAKVCYALSMPIAKSPSSDDHGDVFFFVNFRPTEGIENEPSTTVGYRFRKGSSVAVGVGTARFTLFTEGDSAWIRSTATERQLVNAMKAGHEMTVAGESESGLKAIYRYSLSGVTAAIEAAQTECE